MTGGGAERQLSYLAAPLSARGWSVLTGLVIGGPNLERLVEGGARVEWLRAAGNHDPRLITGIRRLIRREQPDLVHSWLPQMDVLAGVAALTCGVPWLMSERSSGDAFRGTWKDRLRVMLAKHATAIVANSPGGVRFWSARAPRVPVHLIANALEVEAIDATSPATSQQIGVEDDAKIVLAAGRLSPEKNHRLLIEALAKLDRDVIVVICGEGPLLEQTRALAHDLGVADRVRFPGFIHPVWPFMKRANVFVSVGWYEGHPNAVLEAMAARCPVVLSDIEAHRDVLDPDDAVFVDPSSADALATAIRNVLSGAGVVERVQRAKKRAEAFSVDAAGAAHDALYRDVVKTR